MADRDSKGRFLKEHKSGMMGKHHSQLTKNKMSESSQHKGPIGGNSTSFKKGNIPWNKNKEFLQIKGHPCYYKRKVGEFKHSEETKKILREKRLKQHIKIRPTCLEKQMMEIIQRNNLPYKYTGDNSFIIGYKNPDFVNVNGEKIIIEVASPFWHKRNYEETRKEHFSKWGWKCLVFFGSDRLFKSEKEILKEVKEIECQQ